MSNHGLVDPDTTCHMKTRESRCTVQYVKGGTKKKHQSRYLQRFDVYCSTSWEILAVISYSWDWKLV